MITCRRCGRERLVSRKRGICDPCHSYLCQTVKLDTYPPLLPPLPFRPRPDKRAPLGPALRRELAQLWQQGYGTWTLARAFDTSASAVCDALRWAEEHPQ